MTAAAPAHPWPTRRVRVIRDDASPLWFVRCAEPCGQCEVCWLFSGFDAAEVATYAAKTLGYEVVA